MKSILQEYSEKICSICANRKDCQEELRIRLDNTVKCYEYKRIEGEQDGKGKENR